jgi:hypothetical protein
VGDVDVVAFVVDKKGKETGKRSPFLLFFLHEQKPDVKKCPPFVPESLSGTLFLNALSPYAPSQTLSLKKDTATTSLPGVIIARSGLTSTECRKVFLYAMREGLR